MLPSPRPRKSWTLTLAVWLGVLLLISSVGGAAMALRSSPAGAASGEAPAPGLEKAVAIAYVNVEGGVTNLYPLQPGLVASVEVGENKEVEAGTVLFKLDDTAEKQQLALARIAVAAAGERVAQATSGVAQHKQLVKAQKRAVAAAKLDVQIATLNHQRLVKLAGVSSSTEEVEGAQLTIEKAQEAVRGEEAKLARLEAEDPSTLVRLAELDRQARETDVKKAEYALSLCSVKAPERGSVVRRLVNVGETLGPNPQKPALIFAPARPLVVLAEVEQEFARFVYEGQPATVQDDATGVGSWKGTVETVSRWFSQRRSIVLEPLQFNDVRTLECVVKLDPGTKDLRIGQRVRVVLQKKD